MHAAWIESGEETDIEDSDGDNDSESSSDSQTSSSSSNYSNQSDQFLGVTDDGKPKVEFVNIFIAH